jgi:hypothetical protein
MVIEITIAQDATMTTKQHIDIANDLMREVTPKGKPLLHCHLAAPRLSHNPIGGKQLTSFSAAVKTLNVSKK